MSNPSTGLIYKELPTYTAERYYLLSELEQAIKLEVQDETDRLRLGLDDAVIFYHLWNLKITPPGEFCKLLGSSVLDLEKPLRWCLCVEVLSELPWSQDRRDFASISEVNQWLKDNEFEGESVTKIFGISSKPSGSPALEAVLEASIKARSLRSCRLVVPCRDCLLGHDPAHYEPDAESGVSQGLLFSLPRDMEMWVNKSDSYTPTERPDSSLWVQLLIMALLFLLGGIYWWCT